LLHLLILCCICYIALLQPTSAAKIPNLLRQQPLLKRFPLGLQHDAHELLLFLLDKLDEERDHHPLFVASRHICSLGASLAHSLQTHLSENALDVDRQDGNLSNSLSQIADFDYQRFYLQRTFYKVGSAIHDIFQPDGIHNKLRFLLNKGSLTDSLSLRDFSFVNTHQNKPVKKATHGEVSPIER